MDDACDWEYVQALRGCRGACRIRQGVRLAAKVSCISLEESFFLTDSNKTLDAFESASFSRKLVFWSRRGGWKAVFRCEHRKQNGFRDGGNVASMDCEEQSCALRIPLLSSCVDDSVRRLKRNRTCGVPQFFLDWWIAFESDKRKFLKVLFKCHKSWGLFSPFRWSPEVIRPD